MGIDAVAVECAHGFTAIMLFSEAKEEKTLWKTFALCAQVVTLVYTQQ
jgi:hypothetical protein